MICHLYVITCQHDQPVGVCSGIIKKRGLRNGHNQQKWGS